jgi:hypothetical protein
MPCADKIQRGGRNNDDTTMVTVVLVLMVRGRGRKRERKMKSRITAVRNNLLLLNPDPAGKFLDRNLKYNTTTF